MSELTVNEYLHRVRGAMRSLPADAATDALTELAAHIRDEVARRGGGVDAERAVLDGLGDPEEYAASIAGAYHGTEDQTDDTTPQGRLLGMPYDFRGPSTGRLLDRLWNPADPRVFMPRTFGLGWTLNFGALAVKLGLIRPDDIEEEAFANTPRWVVYLALAVPVLLALALVAIVACAWSSLPAELPIHWGPSGAPDDWAPKGLTVGFLGIIGVLPIVVTYSRILRAGTPMRTRVLSASVLALFGTLALGIGVMTVLDADGGSSGSWVWLVILVSLVLSFVMLFVPARLSLRAEWQRTAEREEQK